MFFLHTHWVVEPTLLRKTDEINHFLNGPEIA